MAAIDTSSNESMFSPSQSRPLPSRSHVSPTAEHYALSDEQTEILAILDGRPTMAVAASDEAPGSGWGLDVAFATVGAAAIVSGVVMVFFFAAAGSVLLVLGAILCAVAFEHVAINDLRSEEAALLRADSAEAPLPEHP